MAISYSSSGIFNGMSIAVTSTGTWASDNACPCPMCQPDKCTADKYFNRYHPWYKVVVKT